MPVTRSSAAERKQAARPPIAWRQSEALWLLAASFVLAFGFMLVYQAKSSGLAAVDTGLAGKQLIDLNELSSREDLLPFLGIFTQPAERQFVAHKIYDASGDLKNVGALARLRFTGAEIEHTRGLKAFHERHSPLLLTSEQFH